MSTTGYVVIQSPPPPELQPDSVIVSYLKCIAAAGQRTIRRKQREQPRKFRLASHFDAEVIEIMLKYAEGDEDLCYHPSCLQPVEMTDAIRNFKACAVCRAKSAMQTRESRARRRATRPQTARRAAKKVRIRFALG